MSEVNATSGGKKTMSYSIRVQPISVLRLEMLAAVYGQSIGHLVDQMVAKNFNHIRENGKLAEYMAQLEVEEDEQP